ncbi:MAG: GntR family transcriptional regulator [Parasphingopyxis sp.]|uniref:FadR/GntR family transcriptional regulator n=1 Tax=Parasphingopyxis sp. TaxID=1920299 RepID=UPI002610558E|nr:GntR family transcriptional regulator [uncultured Parasphingopyxis sp.]
MAEANAGNPSSKRSRLAPRPNEKPLRVPKTAEIIADKIRHDIIAGRLKEGDSLPPEAQLMETFSISRPTLREAFRILEAERLINVVRGSRTGARVHEPRVESVSRYASFVLQSSGVTVADLYEARLAIEPHVVRDLANKSSKTAVKRLREEAQRLAEMAEAERYAEFMVGIAEFHRVLVEVGGNETLHLFTRVLQDVAAQFQVRNLSLRPRDPVEQKKSSRAGNRSFEKLIDLIEAGEADAAEQHWRLHLINANKVWAIDMPLRDALSVSD